MKVILDVEGKGSEEGELEGKQLWSGLYKRNGYVKAEIVRNTGVLEIFPIIKQKVKLQSIVYTDSYHSYDRLDVEGFEHRRINHSKVYVEGNNHINGIENFWNQSKRHLRKYNGIPKKYFELYLKECEWRFNYRPMENLYNTLLIWVKEAFFVKN